jgi:hypothetical protein
VAPRPSTARARSTERIPPPTRQNPADARDERFVGSLTLRRVEVDELDFRKRGESPDPAFDVCGLDGKALALDQLDDAPSMQVD